MSQPSPRPLPDIGRMHDLKEDFLKQLYGTTHALLPALREQLGGLSERLLSTDRLLAERVLSALVLIGNHKWDALGAAPQETHQELEQDAQRDAQRLEGKGREIGEALTALGRVRLPGVDERLDSLNEQKTTLGEAITNQKARIGVLDGQIAAMAEVINAFEAPDLQSIFNRMIPTETELALIQQTLLKGVSPELLVTAARTFVEKVSGIVEGRKLSAVIATRSRKVIERGALQDELCAWEYRRAGIDRELGQLPRVAVIGGVRDQWLELARVLSRDWTEQVATIRARTTLADMARELCAMQDYLLAVRRLYEEV